jgi:hypothetical protein
MDASPDPLDVLARLYLAYPDKVHDPATVSLYLDSLADIPVWLLEQAVQRQIRTSEWFPKISELRQLAAQIANTRQFETLHPPHPLERLAGDAWALISQAQELEDAFYRLDRLDPAEWGDLAARFERLERPERAAYTLEKLRRLQAIREKQAQADAIAHPQAS